MKDRLRFKRFQRICQLLKFRPQIYSLINFEGQILTQTLQTPLRMRLIGRKKEKRKPLFLITVLAVNRFFFDKCKCINNNNYHFKKNFSKLRQRRIFRWLNSQKSQTTRRKRQLQRERQSGLFLRQEVIEVQNDETIDEQNEEIDVC